MLDRDALIAKFNAEGVELDEWARKRPKEEQEQLRLNKALHIARNMKLEAIARDLVREHGDAAVRSWEAGAGTIGRFAVVEKTDAGNVQHDRLHAAGLDHLDAHSVISYAVSIAGRAKPRRRPQGRMI